MAAEVLGIITGVAGVLETSLELIDRARTALARQRGLAANLATWRAELTRALGLVATIRSEPALRTSGVTAELGTMKGVGDKLASALEEIAHKCARGDERGEPGTRDKIRGFFHQVFDGERDEERVKTLMGEMGRCQAALALRVQVAHVGVTRTVERGLFANIDAIERVDARLKEVLGEDRGLRIKELVKERSPQADATDVPIAEMELMSLDDGESAEAASPASKPTDSEAKTGGPVRPVRIIADNLTYDQALQINGPIGVEDWAAVSRVEIRDNKAFGNSTQNNNAMSLDAFRALLAHRAGASA